MAGAAKDKAFGILRVPGSQPPVAKGGSFARRVIVLMFDRHLRLPPVLKDKRWNVNPLPVPLPCNGERVAEGLSHLLEHILAHSLLDMGQRRLLHRARHANASEEPKGFRRGRLAPGGRRPTRRWQRTLNASNQL